VSRPARSPSATTKPSVLFARVCARRPKVLLEEDSVILDAGVIRILVPDAPDTYTGVPMFIVDPDEFLT